MPTRDPEPFIDHFVSLVLTHIDREYPNKLDHVINDESELKGPRALHPIFYGSFDWHSSVHGHWLLVRALRNFPALSQAAEVRQVLDQRFTPEHVATEVEYLGHKRRETFERTYGWAWLLKLAAELRAPASPWHGLPAHVLPTLPPSTLPAPKPGGDEGSPPAPAPSPETAAALSRWDKILQPLTDAFVARYFSYLPKATYPIRVGTHMNTAFGLALALDYALIDKNTALTNLITDKAKSWYLADANYPAWEPDGSDFLSPGLMEAECVRRVLTQDEFLPWFDRFFPNLKDRQPATLFKPAFVSDRTDGHITHLDGLNLSRAWCWRSIAGALPENDPRRAHAQEAYHAHLDAALPHVTGDYVGEHWLATFALLAMTE